MSEVHRVGRDVDAYCTKCKLDLAAVVIAVVGGVAVKVECNTCHTVRKYRPPKTGPQPVRGRATTPRASRASRSTTPKPTAAERKAERTAMSQREHWLELVAGRTKLDATRYDIRQSYESGTLLDHSKFGLGVVTGPHADDRIEVQFSDGEKVLICNFKR